MLPYDPLQLIVLAGAMDAALMHRGIRRELRGLGRSAFDLGFGGEPVFEIMAGRVAAFRVMVVGGLADHRFALLQAERTSPRNVGGTALLRASRGSGGAGPFGHAFVLHR